MTTALPDAIIPVTENGVPCSIATCSKDGVPNATIISKVQYVDAETVALSFQFFNKTIRNVRDNPQLCATLTDIPGGAFWVLQLEYLRSETEGPTFEQMSMQIEAIASITGMSDVFKLKAADIYRVRDWKRLSSP